MFSSRFTDDLETNRNRIANRVYDTIPEGIKSALKEITGIKNRLGPNRLDLAHPIVFVSDLHQFMETINPSAILRSVMEELETMEVWRDDRRERLFLPIDNS